jgi:ABC-type Mn2+/Zn2+ transport system permease subunit
MDEIKIPQAKEFFEDIKKVSYKDMKMEFLSRIVTIIIAGLALITALAWDEVLKDIFHRFLEEFEGLNARLGYAIFLTLISVIVTIIVTKLFLKKKRSDLKN